MCIATDCEHRRAAAQLGGVNPECLLDNETRGQEAFCTPLCPDNDETGPTFLPSYTSSIATLEQDTDYDVDDVIQCIDYLLPRDSLEIGEEQAGMEDSSVTAEYEVSHEEQATWTRKERGVSFASDPIQSVHEIPDRSTYSPEERKEIWYNPSELRQLKSSTYSACRSAIKSRLSRVLEDAFSNPSTSPTLTLNLASWCKHGHARRGLELYCNLKHRNDRLEQMDAARSIVLRAQEGGCSTEDISRLYQAESDRAREFAFAMAAADAEVVRRERRRENCFGSPLRYLSILGPNRSKSSTDFSEIPKTQLSGAAAAAAALPPFSQGHYYDTWEQESKEEDASSHRRMSPHEMEPKKKKKVSHQSPSLVVATPRSRFRSLTCGSERELMSTISADKYSMISNSFLS